MASSFIETILHAITGLGVWGYLIVFGVGFFERAALVGSFLPGGLIVILVGLIAAHGYLDLAACFFVVAAGTIAGDSINYLMGNLLGEKYFEHHQKFLFIKKKHIAETDRYFAQEGGKTIFVGRFVSFLQSAVSLAAGMSGYSYKLFLAYDVLGNVVWSVAYLLLGYFFGWSWKSIHAWPARVAAGFSVLLLIYLFTYIYRKEKKRADRTAR